MEKDGMFTKQQQPCFFNMNWEQQLMSMPAPQFESSSLSLVNSDSMIIQELVGRLGTIGNTSNANTCLSQQSCYSTTQLNSSMQPPFCADPCFAERAMKFSSFGPLQSQFVLPELRQLSQVAVNVPGAAQFCNQARANRDIPNSAAGEETDPVSGSGSGNSRKRKAPANSTKAKGRETPLSSPKHPSSSSSKIDEDEADAKRLKPGTGSKTEKGKTEQSDGSGDQMQGVKLPEPPKDYIHVRARRGQATDSHSLAERVRREKISERMKFLQDLVPGCNKVTGKAVMLDEIINYVQSLQRQVEFLSMKLATVNPRLDFNVENILSKDLPQQGQLQLSVYQMEPAATVTATATEAGTSLPYLPQHPHSNSSPLQGIVTNSAFDSHCSPNPLVSNVRPSSSIPLPSVDVLGDATISQLASLWDDDAHSVFQMSFLQNQEPTFSSQVFHGTIPAAQMKIEL